MPQELEADNPSLNESVIHYPPEATQQCFALVDCNNFYASCERVFNPKLKGKPILVLSSNDACIIALSNEAKVFGIKVGAPLFENAHIVKKNKIITCSSNFSLYGDMSQRVMSILSGFAPELEVYSIDEAFLNLKGCDYLNNTNDITEYARTIGSTILKCTGLPVSIGIASTKALAKIANRHAKKSDKANGVFNLLDSPHINEALEKIEVVEIWGVGYRSARKLTARGIANARQLRDVDDKFIRRIMGISGLRLVYELRGISCLSLDSCPAPRKGIMSSQSFGRKVDNINDIKEAVTAFVSNTANKLRSQKSAARVLTVFLMTDYYNKFDPWHSESAVMKLPSATNHTAELVRCAMKGVEQIFKKGCRYKKAGVRLDELVPADQAQISLFAGKSFDHSQKLMDVIDFLNDRLGSGTLRYATQGTIHPWKAKSEMVSPRYTTSWEELVKVSAK